MGGYLGEMWKGRLERLQRSSAGKKKLIFYIFLFAVVLVIAGMLHSASAKSTSKEFTITASQFAYDPPIIRVNLGDNVTIRLRSADVSHGLFIDGYGINVKLIMNETEVDAYVRVLREKVIEFTADKQGVYRFRCSVTCGYFHPFMSGKLIVEPNSQFLLSSILAVSISAVFVTYTWKNHDRLEEGP